MTEEKSLDDILTGQQPDEADQTQSDTPPDGQEAEPGNDAEATPAQTDGQQGAGEGEPDKNEANDDSQPDDSDPKAWQYAAYKDEKAKRQELEGKVGDAERARQEAERRAREMQEQLQAATQPKPEPVDPYEDPEGYQRQQRESLQQSVNQRLLAQSRVFAERIYGKDTVEEAYKWACDHLPAHEANAIAASADPFGECVERKKKADALAEIGSDPKAWAEAERERIRAELLAEQQGGQPKTPATPMPSNLAGARSAGARTGPAWSGPPSIDDIFSQRK